MKIQYTRPRFGEEQRSIAGGYTAQEQILLIYKDRLVLCVSGNVFLDTSCCGSSNWSYIQVVGYLLSELDTPGKEIPAVLEVDTIEREEDKIGLRRLLLERYPGAKIEFR